MRKLILVMCFLASGCSQSEPAGSGAGKAYYQALNCKACHRVGQDGGTSGPDLTTVGFRRSSAWLDVWMKDPQAWKADTMMPNPHLSDKARAGLVEYLSSLRGEDFAGNPPWAGLSGTEKGHMIFAKAGCIACHGKGGVGGYPNNNVKGNKIPALNGVAQTYKKDELIAKITRGVKPQKADMSGPEPLVEMPPWGKFLKPDEIDAVADYLMSLKGGAAQDAGF